MVEQTQRLLEDHVRLKRGNEELKKSVTILEGQLWEMHTKMMNLVKAISEMEKELKELQDQGQPISETNRLKIIHEYKTSPELTEAILD